MIEGRVLLYKKVEISSHLYLWRENDERFQAGEVFPPNKNRSESGRRKVGTNTGVKTTNKQNINRVSG